MDKLAYLGSLSTGYYEDSAVLATFQGQKVTASMVSYKQEAASMTYSSTRTSRNRNASQRCTLRYGSSWKHIGRLPA